MTDLGIDLRSVLESVVRITEQRSRETLEQCLVSTLLDLTTLSRVVISRPLMRPDGLHVEVVAAASRQGDDRATDGTCLPLDSDTLVAQAWALGEESRMVAGDGTVRLCLPISGHAEDVSAFLTIETRSDPAPVLDLVRGFAAIYRNFLAILREAERDTLTGLKNRKTFDEKLGRIISQARGLGQHTDQERRQPASDDRHWLGLMDIDHFKRINDGFGHVFGDEVLLLFSALMRKVFRSEDLLFRFGGEEFVVVLAPTSPDKAQRTFERFRRAVEAFTFPQVGQVTVSIGFVQVRGGDIASAVIGQADEALYWAKRNGRNRVCLYDDLVKDGHLAPHTKSGEAELF